VPDTSMVRTLLPAELRHGPCRVAVFRALQLGDMLCVVPALRALRKALPQAEITLIGLPWAAAFASRFSCYIDDFLRFPGFPGLPESTPVLSAIPGFIAVAQQRRFDLLLQMHGSGGLSNPLCASFGAARQAGFHEPGGYSAEPMRSLEWNPQEHEVMRYLRLLDFIGIEQQGTHLEFPLQAADHHELRSLDPALPASGTYACIHPGSQLASRRWPAERFAGIADRLADAGLKIVLTGTAAEAGITRAVMRSMQSAALDLTGKTTLGGLAALIAGARVLVCNDTGVSHIAAAVTTPSVVVCCGADPRRWAPLDRMRHRVLHQAVECRPCRHAACPVAGHPCATGVEVATVWQAAADLLGQFARVMPTAGAGYRMAAPAPRHNVGGIKR
jgi:ADP-heptose:LPS heptosyltransferase